MKNTDFILKNGKVSIDKQNNKIKIEVDLVTTKNKSSLKQNYFDFND